MDFIIQVFVACRNATLEFDLTKCSRHKERSVYGCMNIHLVIVIVFEGPKSISRSGISGRMTYVVKSRTGASTHMPQTLDNLTRPMRSFGPPSQPGFSEAPSQLKSSSAARI